MITAPSTKLSTVTRFSGLDHQRRSVGVITRSAPRLSAHWVSHLRVRPRRGEPDEVRSPNFPPGDCLWRPWLRCTPDGASLDGQATFAAEVTGSHRWLETG